MSIADGVGVRSEPVLNSEDLRERNDLRVVRLFAIARQLAGAAEVSVLLPPSATVADLRWALAHQHPALAGIVDRVRIAVGDEYADDSQEVPSSAALALIPPVSGGGPSFEPRPDVRGS